MYTETSKRQQIRFFVQKNTQPKCFKTADLYRIDCEGRGKAKRFNKDLNDAIDKFSAVFPPTKLQPCTPYTCKLYILLFNKGVRKLRSERLSMHLVQTDS